MTSGWSFGFLQTKKGELILCEIYDLGKYGIGAAYVDWKQLRRDKKMILDDIADQIKHKVEFWEARKNGVEMRINGKLKRKAVAKEPRGEKFIAQAELCAEPGLPMPKKGKKQ